MNLSLSELSHLKEGVKLIVQTPGTQATQNKKKKEKFRKMWKVEPKPSHLKIKYKNK